MDGTTWSLSHRDRLGALHDHGEFFAELSVGSKHLPIPSCPEWTVEDARQHVAGGAGAVRELAERAHDENLDPYHVIGSRMSSVSEASFEDLRSMIRSYAGYIVEQPPQAAACLHLGRDTVGTEVWHTIGDWGMHRHDVEVVLGVAPTLSVDRSIDLIMWFSEYLLPTVETLRGLDPRPRIRCGRNPIDSTTSAARVRSLQHRPGAPRDLLMH